MIKKNYKIIFFFLFLSFLSLNNFVFAEENIEEVVINPEYHINLDKDTIAKGYTVSAFDNSLKLSLVPGILGEATGVDVIKINSEMEIPWDFDLVSDIYQFEFKNKNAYDNHKPFYIQFSYNEEENNNYKQVFFYDKNYSSWRPLPTKDYPEENFVRSLIHLPFARIAILSNPEILTVGKASWYGYKGGDFAASPDFPKGSKLRVYNVENEKFVDVEINDYGPDRGLHPDRVIDLDKVAFGKIANLGEGIINVKVEPIFIFSASSDFSELEEKGASLQPSITAKSAILINEDTEEIILEKNATSTLPLASLTKIVAIKVFLETRPTLNNVVSYSVKDEEYNYEYCSKWESARLKLNDQDTLTIEDLIYSSLVGSANNSIETLVRVSGLSRENFILRMNSLVTEWGASSTKFIEPTGLSPENVSSAKDYAIITKEVFKNPIIEKASSVSEYEFSTINTKEKHTIKNTNNLIRTGEYNIKGSKTGYLDEAGYCLMVRIFDGKNKIIAITFGADSRDLSFDETEQLLKYGLRILN